MAIAVRRKIDSCLLILIEESYINKGSEKQLRSGYDQFISSVPICCCGIESVRSKVVSFQPRSQGLSSNRPLRRARRDPGLVWSRVCQILAGYK